MKQYISVGYSGHAYVLIDSILDNGGEILGYFEKQQKQDNPFSIAYLGDESEEEVLARYEDKEIGLVLGIGDNRVRKKIYEQVNDRSFARPAIIDRAANVSARANVGETAFIAKGASVNAGAGIGTGAIVNTGSIVEHECKIGDFAHLAPGAVLSGNVSVGSLSLIGANAVVKQGVSIGSRAIIGAGSVVLRDIPAGETWVGNPAKPLS